MGRTPLLPLPRHVSISNWRHVFPIGLSAFDMAAVIATHLLLYHCIPPLGDNCNGRGCSHGPLAITEETPVTFAVELFSTTDVMDSRCGRSP